jgi:hypothetical protein
MRKKVAQPMVEIMQTKTTGKVKKKSSRKQGVRKKIMVETSQTKSTGQV